MASHKFLHILRAALMGSHPENLSVTEKEYEEILRLAELHKVLPLVFDVIHSYNTQNTHILRQKVRLMVSQQTLRTEAFKTLYSELNRIDLNPVVIKGFVLRSLYPNPDLRISADEDLLIPPSEYNKYRQALMSMGFVPKNETSETHQTAFIRNDGFYLELHTSLFSRDTKLFTKWNALFEDSASNRTYEEIDGLKILTLSPTDHLLYLILHALKHFIHSGVGIRQVCDISMFIHRYHPVIDFDYIFKMCEMLGALKFTLGFIAICQNHLGLKENIPLPYSVPDETLLLDDILCAGIYGNSTMSRKHSGSLTFSAANKGKKQRLIKRVLPGPAHLDRRYSYAKRTPALLPVAWGHRLLNYCKETKKSENNSPKDAVKIGNNRINLLREYGLISD